MCIYIYICIVYHITLEARIGKFESVCLTDDAKLLTTWKNTRHEMVGLVFQTWGLKIDPLDQYSQWSTGSVV